jgi:hypothetical protein
VGSIGRGVGEDLDFICVLILILILTPSILYNALVNRHADLLRIGHVSILCPDLLWILRRFKAKTDCKHDILEHADLVTTHKHRDGREASPSSGLFPMLYGIDVTPMD